MQRQILPSYSVFKFRSSTPTFQQVDPCVQLDLVKNKLYTQSCPLQNFISVFIDANDCVHAVLKKAVVLTQVSLSPARWCGPCQILGPRLEKAVAKQKGRVAMAKVDIDDHTDLAIEYGVRSDVLSFFYFSSFPLRNP